MLIAAITAFLLIHFGHSSGVVSPFDDAAALISKDVADEARRSQALKIVDEMKAEAKAYEEKRDKSTADLAKLIAQRGTPFAEVQRAVQPLFSEDRASAERLLDLRFKLKSVLTADEWAKVFPAPPAQPASARKTTARRATTQHTQGGLV